MAVGREHERDEYTEGHRYTDTQTHRRGGAPYLSLDCTRAPKLLHLGLDGGDGLLERLDTLRLVEGVGSDNVHGRGIELDLDRELFGAALEALAQALLDGLDTLVCEARDLEVGAQADGLRRQTALDVRTPPRECCRRATHAVRLSEWHLHRDREREMWRT